ncbi:NADH-ubiquinone oxidoreductase-F iron-sulfur binding region domain-containing protein [Actinacidiphila sp. SB3-2]
MLAGLGEGVRLDRVGHLTVHGSLPHLPPGELAELAENIALRGRGGAGFPFARKLRAVYAAAARHHAGGRQGNGGRGTGGRGNGGRGNGVRSNGGRARPERHTAVVVNATEGEPACLKDTALLLYAPHLVLDGALLAARELGAGEIRVGVTREDTERSVRAAAAERGPEGVRTRVTRLPERFVTGESSALVNGLNQLPPLPSGRGVRSSESGLYGLPTLLSNAETFAQLAVAARLGALEYRTAGLPDEPGTALLTLAGGRVLEVPYGVPLPHVLGICGLHPGQGVLVGGYHGTWLGPQSAWRARVSRESLEGFGATLGAGAVLPLPEDTCPAGEAVRVAHWLAAESAGQCGPCVLGLPALAGALAEVAAGGGQSGLEAVRERAAAVVGRGACGHPDGTARFVASALSAFPGEFTEHALGRGCGRPVRGVLPLPGAGAHSGPATTGGPATDGAVPAGPGAPPPPRERLVVNWTLCQGHGLCAGVLPEAITLDEDGYPTRGSNEVPAHLRRDAQRAVRRCPALALRLED